MSYPSPHKQIFPVPHSDCNDGITLLEHYAGLAMQGILANQIYQPPRRQKFLGMAEDAVAAAKFLIAELEKESKQ
jgi:hypothetical protein